MDDVFDYMNMWLQKTSKFVIINQRIFAEARCPNEIYTSVNISDKRR